MTDGRAFVDTNVLLRSIHTSMPLHKEADVLIKATQQSNQLWISRQVLREYLVQVTRPGILTAPLTVEQAFLKISVIRSTFRVADETDTVTDKLLELIAEFPTQGKQIHDANIVATMLV